MNLFSIIFRVKQNTKAFVIYSSFVLLAPWIWLIAVSVYFCLIQDWRHYSGHQHRSRLLGRKLWGQADDEEMLPSPWIAAMSCKHISVDLKVRICSRAVADILKLFRSMGAFTVRAVWFNGQCVSLIVLNIIIEIEEGIWTSLWRAYI